MLMIEGMADFLSEEQMVEAVGVAHAAVRRICVALEAWAAKVEPPPVVDRTTPCSRTFVAPDVGEG